MSLIARLGLDAAIIRFFPALVPSQAASLVTTALRTTALSALLAGVIGLPIAWFVVPELRPSLAQPLLIVATLVCILAVTWSMILDATFTAAARAGIVVAKNAGASAIRIPLALFLFAVPPVMGIFGSYVLAYLAACVLAIAVGLPRAVSGFSLRAPGRLADHRELGLVRFAFSSYLTGIIGPFQVTAGLAAILNLLVLQVYGPLDAAYFFLATTFMGFLYVIPLALSSAWSVERAAGRSAAAESQRHLRLAVVLVVLGLAFFAVAGGFLLMIFSSRLAANGSVPLLLMVASALPATIGAFYLAMLRLARRETEGLLYAGGLAILMLILAALAVRSGFGLKGVGGAILLAHLALAIPAGLRLRQLIAHAREDSHHDLARPA